MKQLSLAMFLVLSGSLAQGQVAAAGAAAVTAAAPHIVAALPAIVTGAVSSGSAHVGQAVLAKLASPSVLSDGTKLPAGTQLLGHLTQVQSLAQGGGKSSLGMVFDHFKMPDGTQKELASGVLKSVGSERSRKQKEQSQSTEANAQASGSGSAGNPVGGLLGGVTNAVGTTVNGVGTAVKGLVGTVTSLPGVVLDSAGTLAAKGREVQVPAGTQVSIAASASAGSQ